MNIRPFKTSELEEVLSVHEECFAVFNFDYEGDADFYQSFFAPSRTVVADNGRGIVGFGCYLFFDGDFFVEPDQKQEISDCINLDGEAWNRLCNKIRKMRREIGGGEFIWEVYDNQFSEMNYEVQEKDMNFTSLAILPAYRGQGIGKALTLERLRIAAEHGSSAVFADCWEGGYSPKLCRSLGFVPILRIGPWYNDGAAALVMGKKVE